MIIIAHRANLHGPDPGNENSPSKIKEAISLGYHVEVDVWYINGSIFLGHDGPVHRVQRQLLEDDRVWCHAKNIEALEYLVNNNLHCFWHQSDDCTLTTRGYLWTYPGRQITPKSVCVMPEEFDPPLEDMVCCAAVCTDYPEKYKIILGKEM